MCMQGHPTTLPVSIDEMAYHTGCVARGNRTAWVIADMPFGSYQESSDLAVHHAVRLMQAGAHMVKLEGGGWTTPIVRSFVERGIPVCAHLGFTPQSVHALGGYRVQGRDEAAAGLLRKDAKEIAAAGAALLVLEMVPGTVARDLTSSLSDPDHRHRRRCRLQRAGAGAARYARADAGRAVPIRARFHGGRARVSNLPCGTMSRT